MRSKGYFFLLLIIASTFIITSCERSTGILEQDDPPGSLEDRLEVSYDGTRTAAEIELFKELPIHPVFAMLMNDYGYKMHFSEAVHYKAYDPAKDKLGHMTLIPCSIPGDDSKVAMIEYFRSGDKYAVTAAEFFSHEEYQVAHPLDEKAALAFIDEDFEPELKCEILERSSMSASFWQCVAKRFVAGCAGCATVCWLSGPLWGPCTMKCCAGSAVVAFISCAATIFLGW